ncbi:MAG: hypothetical protein ACI8YQ_003005 [Polaribacter sp.]|jgi:hypothetical protein
MTQAKTTTPTIDPVLLVPFLKTTQATLYGLKDSSFAAGDTWFGFITTNSTPPDEISVSDAFNDDVTNEPTLSGSFVFCGAEPDQNAFVDQLAAILKGKPTSRFFLWYDTPNTAGSSGLQLEFAKSNTPPDQGLFIILRPFTYSLKNISLKFDASIQIQYDADTKQFKFYEVSTSKIRLHAGPGSSFVDGITNPVILPATEAETGAFQFNTSMMIGGYNVNNDFSLFSVGMIYSANQATSDFDQFYPVFGLPEEGNLLYFTGAFHCFYPLDTTKSYLQFIPETGKDKTITVGTFFNTNLGEALAVKPVANNAMLVFAPDMDNRFYFTLAGDFEWRWSKGSASTGEANLLAGLGGTETISITPGLGLTSGDIISFHSANPSYAPLFPIISQNPLIETINPKTLTTDMTSTAWVSIKKVSSSENIYFAQPKGNSLYAKGQGISADFPKLLGHYPTCSGHLDKPTDPIIFPMVPYAGLNLNVQSNCSDVSGFETQILASIRKANIEKAILALADPIPNGDNKILSTSPQGLLIQVDESTCRWDLLQLAKNNAEMLVDGIEKDVTYNLAFNQLSRKLQSAFQTQQQFLVISQNKPLEPGNPKSALTLGELKANKDCPTPDSSSASTFCNEMSIEGWPFFAQVPTEITTPGKFDNVVIFKFSTGSLKDRILNTKLWTNPDDFNSTENNGLENLSGWLSQYIDDGIKKYEEGDADYQKFYEIATNDGWTGILVLKAKIGLEDFPEDLQGLLGGVDISLFNAHHFGVDVNFIKPDPNSNSLSMEARSSMFGLIDYEDPSFAPFVNDIPAYKKGATISRSVDYDYKVLLLKVLFENSKIKNFNSYLQLVANKLFSETVIADNRANLQILKGTYENHDGTPSYIFNTTEIAQLYLESAAINRVEAIKINFSTLLPQQTGDDDKDIIHARFAFFGYLNFNDLTGFDLFSFGSEPKAEGAGLQETANQGLSYSNLYIDMVFDINTPNNKTFTFDTSQIAFNLGQSTTRIGSLFPHFPLNLRGLTVGTDKNSPESQGYLTVELPELEQQQTVSAQWYGLQYDLDMGTLGALASEAGFNASFIIMWEVGGTGADAGIQLPGVNSQSKFFSLQGVLKLTIETIKLQKGIALNSEGEPDPSKTAYLMMINDIALKFLSVKIPPGGDINFYLFGDPDENAKPGSLGWYAAYNKN